MKIAIGLPTPEFVNAEFALDNLYGIISYTKKHLKPEDGLVISYQTGVRTDRNRNIILERFIKQGDVDYVLWLDVDMLYPHDIICKYMEGDFDVIGCLYFKRAAPYEPVAYLKSGNPQKPYQAINPQMIAKDKVYTVDGLGFGGMMVNMKVYEKMGEDKWARYGENYHLPYPAQNKLTHDLWFCQKAQEHGFEIMLHGGVRPGHIASYPISETDFDREWGGKIATDPKNPFVLRYLEDYSSVLKPKSPKIHVLMPTIHPDKAQKTAEILKVRAGMDCDIFVLEDKQKQGYVTTINQGIKDHPADYYVYLTDEEFPRRNWLKIAYEALVKSGKGLLGFNDGKWDGNIACVGLVSHEFMSQNYGGNLFYPGYFGHYNDTELTMVALQKDQYFYDPGIVLMEIDYDKEKKSVNPSDLELFRERRETNFDGLITNLEIIKKYQ